jgi:hypothetical protein
MKQEERQLVFSDTLVYVYIAFAKYLDGNMNPEVTSAIRTALLPWFDGFNLSDKLDETIQTVDRYLTEDANSPEGLDLILENFFFYGEHWKTTLNEELKNEVMMDLEDIARADAELNETEEKWIKAFGRALGENRDLFFEQLENRDLSAPINISLYFSKKDLDEYILVEGEYWDESSLLTYSYSADLVILWRAGSLSTDSMSLGQTVELLKKKPLLELVATDFSDLRRASDCEYPEVHENEGVKWFLESSINEGPNNYDPDDLIYGDITIRHQEFQFTGVQKIVLQIGDERFEFSS